MNTPARRRTYRHGQLRPLAQRLTPEQLDRRQYRIQYRRRIAIAHGIRLQLQSVFARGFWGRLKFAFRGV